MSGTRTSARREKRVAGGGFEGSVTHAVAQLYFCCMMDQDWHNFARPQCLQVVNQARFEMMIHWGEVNSSVPLVSSTKRTRLTTRTGLAPSGPSTTWSGSTRGNA